jgi:hypothetical protein
VIFVSSTWAEVLIFFSIFCNSLFWNVPIPE